jgi:hypothetical protein
MVMVMGRGGIDVFIRRVVALYNSCGVVWVVIVIVVLVSGTKGNSKSLIPNTMNLREPKLDIIKQSRET